MMMKNAASWNNLTLEDALEKSRNMEETELYSGTFVLYVTEPLNPKCEFWS